ncbi:hypothetical protein IFM89_004471 [Coptis chinensis]|uniref:F-box protein At3g26010-like beta-propeller domain-containing protein n=1 Tax=Coptis chinensis TaxID=261450 RepID=A0A835GUL4_9MAGN|nr:hypothetical protein IFM89_004471 [Coptis chinensis]
MALSHMDSSILQRAHQCLWLSSGKSMSPPRVHKTGEVRRQKRTLPTSAEKEGNGNFEFGRKWFFDRELMWRSGSYLDIPFAQNKSITSPSLIVREKHGAKRPCIAVGGEMKDIFSNDDIAIEIFSRLPIEDTNKLKCVYCQTYFDSKVVSYISHGKEGKHATTKNILDFLPEKVVAITSCNGVLLCRSIFEECRGGHHFYLEKLKIAKDVIMYVCNPFTKDWTILKPRGKYKNGCCYGFACNQFSSAVSLSFEVVMVQPPLRLGKDSYIFKIYSSTSGAWRTSKEVCTLPDRVLSHQSCFTNGVFYWLTTNHAILSFDLKQERSQVIKLPGNAIVTLVQGEGVCLGVSEGKLHYISFNAIVLMVWVLEDDNLRPKWSLKHSKPQLEMHHPLLEVCGGQSIYVPFSRDRANRRVRPYALHDDMLFMRIDWSMIKYNIRTGEFEEELCSCSELEPSITSGTPIVVPYCKSLLQV